MHHVAPTFTTAELPEQFRALSEAYLEGAERLSSELASAAWEPNYHRGQVAMWLAFHATELFLKACVRRAAPGVLKNVHSLGELRLEFASHYPGLVFEPPFGPEPVPADWMLMEMVLESDKTAHEQLRYPVGRQNAPWGGVRTFEPSSFRSEVRQLRADIERVSREVFK